MLSCSTVPSVRRSRPDLLPAPEHAHQRRALRREAEILRGLADRNTAERSTADRKTPPPP